MNRLRLALVAFVLAVGSVVLAAPPDKPADVANYARTGFLGGWSSHYAMDANTTTKPVFINSGEVPAVFGWGTPIVVSSSVDQTFCLTLTSSVTLGSQSTRAANLLFHTSASSGEHGGAADHQGACVAVRAGGTVTIVPRYQTWFPDGASDRIAPGRLLGICTGTQSPVIDKPVRPFCATSADCTDAGATGPCLTVNTSTRTAMAKRTGGAMLTSKALTAGYRDVWIEK